MENISDRLGICLICGQRVHSDESHVEAAEGYAHHNCLADTAVTA
ncbi:MAG: hypothetical protein ACI9LV_000279 [Candidatus Nanohaloarchaea archaeon]|jgi:hypothetical protein